jgi:hypothetical protein
MIASMGERYRPDPRNVSRSEPPYGADALDALEPRLAGDGLDLLWGVEADPRRTGCASAAGGAFQARPVRRVCELDRQHERHHDQRPDGHCCELAQGVCAGRFRDVHQHAAGRHQRCSSRIEASADERLPPVVAGLEVDGDQAKVVRYAVPELLEALPLPSLRARLVGLEDAQPPGEFRAALDERVEPGTEHDVLVEPLVHEKVFDLAGAGDERGSVGAGADPMHVGSVVPAGLRGGQREADLGRRSGAAVGRPVRAGRATTQSGRRCCRAPCSRERS